MYFLGADWFSFIWNAWGHNCFSSGVISHSICEDHWQTIPILGYKCCRIQHDPQNVQPWEHFRSSRYMRFLCYQSNKAKLSTVWMLAVVSIVVIITDSVINWEVFLTSVSQRNVNMRCLCYFRNSSEEFSSNPALWSQFTYPNIHSDSLHFLASSKD